MSKERPSAGDRISNKANSAGPLVAQPAAQATPRAH
jgi:hypothetical protein